MNVHILGAPTKRDPQDQSTRPRETSTGVGDHGLVADSARPNPVGMTLEERFWAKVNKTETCWLWTASQTSTGYGQINVNQRPRKAHRVAYELAIGPIPDGLSIDHLCYTRLCVNPDHLEVVTIAENVSRAHRAGRYEARDARKRSKTHCPRGHEYAGKNLLVRVSKSGQRRRCCRECENAARRTRGRGAA